MMVLAEIRDGRILAVVPWDGGRGKDRAKSIPGHQPKWRKVPGERDEFIGWTYPLAWSTCVALRKTFGRELEIGPELTAWAWDEKRRTDHLEALRDGDGADLPNVRAKSPQLWAALQNRPFQIAGAAFMANGRRVCLGDEPRLGKTYQALAAVVESGARTILIACPRTAVRTVWQRKIQELLYEDAYVAQEGHSNRIAVLNEFASDTQGPGRSWLIVNKEMIRIARRYACKAGNKDQRSTSVPTVNWCDEHGWEGRIKPGLKNGCHGAHEHVIVQHPMFPQLFDTEFDAVILDECHHALASTKNKQSDNISQIRNGAVRLRVKDNGLKLGLSGTPFRSRLHKSWGVLNWLRPDIFTSYWQYAERHFGVKSDGWGQVAGDKLLDQSAFDTELRPYYLARTKAEVAPQLPPVDYVDVTLEMDGQQAKTYQDMKEDAKANVEGGDILANGVLAELVRMRQFACSYGRITGRLDQSRAFYPTLPSNKFDWLLQFLEEREALGGKVVIASQFTKLVNLFATELRSKGYGVLTLTGESDDRQREHAQDEFQNGRTRIIIINMFAGGEAIDLSAADEMVFLDEPWTDDTRQQAENRIASLAKHNKLTIYRLRSESTVEEWIASLNEEQRQTLMAAKPQSLRMMKEALS